MGVPLDKITHHKQNDHSDSNGQLTELDDNGIVDAHALERSIEKFNPDVADGAESDERKQKEIEEHVKSVQPKIFADGFLVFAPREHQLQRPREQTQTDQPIEVVVPRRMQKFIGQIRPIPFVRLYDDVKPVLHRCAVE